MSLGCGIFWNCQYRNTYAFLNLNSRYPIGIRRWALFRDQPKKEGWGNVKRTVEYRSPVCRARICRKSPLIFQHPSFILARRNNRHHFRVSSRMMPMPPGYTKVFGFAPTWCTTNALQKTARRFLLPLKKAGASAHFFWEYAI